MGNISKSERRGALTVITVALLVSAFGFFWRNRNLSPSSLPLPGDNAADSIEVSVLNSPGSDSLLNNDNKKSTKGKKHKKRSTKSSRRKKGKSTKSDKNDTVSIRQIEKEKISRTPHN